MAKKKPKKKKPALPKTPKAKPIFNEWFENLLAQDWYRGSDASGKGVGLAYMGAGRYLTWMENIAEAFAVLAAEESEKYPAKVETYRLTPGLKILDNKSKLMIDIKHGLGVKPWEKIDNPIFSQILTKLVKEQGYDGVIDDNPADGLVIFDAENTIKVDERSVKAQRK